MQKSTPSLRTFAGLVLIALFLQSCGLLSNDPTLLPVESRSQTINFHLQLTSSLTTGQTVVLEVLDPFDSAGGYSTFFPMNSTDGIHYSVDATIPFSSEFRYRYIRQGGEKTPESAPNANKAALRFAIGKTAEINDILSGWVNETNNRQTGVLKGKVTNLSGEPIAGVLIAAGGGMALTDATGVYLLAGLAEGKHTLDAFTPAYEYLPFAQEAIISAGMETQADFSLNSPNFSDVELHLTIPENPFLGQMPKLFISDVANNWTKPIDPTGVPLRLENGQSEYQFTTRQPVGEPFLYRFSFGNQLVNTEVTSDGQLITRSFSPTNPSEIVTSEFDFGSTQQKTVDIAMHLVDGLATPTSMSVLIGDGVFGSPIPMQQQEDGSWRILIRQPIGWKNTYPIQFCRLTICSHNNLDLSAESDVESIDFSSQQNTLLPVNVASWKNFGGWTDLGSEEFLATPKPDYFRFGFSITRETDLSQNGTWENLQNSIDLTKANTIIFERPYLLDATVLELILPEMGISEMPFQNNLGQTHKWIRIKFNGVELQSTLSAGGNGQEPVDALLLERATQILLAEATSAEAAQAEAIILDLSGLQQILPSYEAADLGGNGAQIEAWSAVIAQLRTIFHGQIYGVVNLTEDGISGLPGFATDLDGFIVNWKSQLGDPTELDEDGLANTAFNSIQNDIIPNIPTGKTIYLHLGIPAIEGVLNGCFDPALPCGQGMAIDEQAQAAFYRAVLNAVEWSGNIEGVFSAGFDPTIAMTDASDSVYQKPAMGVIQAWYAGWSEK